LQGEEIKGKDAAKTFVGFQLTDSEVQASETRTQCSGWCWLLERGIVPERFRGRGIMESFWRGNARDFRR
jgi:hypothetical protein